MAGFCLTVYMVLRQSDLFSLWERDCSRTQTGDAFWSESCWDAGFGDLCCFSPCAV